MKKLGILIAVFGVFALAGIASASTTADALQPASTITYSEELVVNATGRFDSVYIGKQDKGGVTFFNGTIVNSTTGEDEANNPVTFGDNVRIDGELFRTEVGGDDPIKLADTIRPQTTATYDLGTKSNQFRNAYFSGTITTTGLSGTGIVSGINILDGTITGEDVSKNAHFEISELTVNSDITVEGNITQNVDSNGVVKGAFSFNPGLYSPTHNGIIKSFGVEVSNVWPITDGITRFTLDISVLDRYFSITPIVSTDNYYPYFCTGGVPNEDPVAYILEVRCYQPAGLPFYNSYVGATYNVLIY
jgi:hypothetical protein